MLKRKKNEKNENTIENTIVYKNKKGYNFN